ncbi:MAG: T9SS type A sorting domain-containing protein, partial [Bacteroidota bacterium]
DSTGSSGSVSVSIIGGTPPYQYNWSNGEADSSLSELSAGVYTVNVTDANGCSLTDSVEVLFSPSVSIEPQFNLRSWRVYPNPTQGQVQLELEWQQQTKANLSLLDLQGKVIEARRLPKAIKHQEKLDLSQLPAGVYIMRIQSEETSLIRRIVKQ